MSAPRYVAAVFCGGRVQFHCWTDTLKEAQSYVDDLTDRPLNASTVVLLEATPQGVEEDAFGEWLDQMFDLLPEGPQPELKVLEGYYGTAAQMLRWAMEEEAA